MRRTTTFKSMNNSPSGWAYIEAKNKYGAIAIENFRDDATCETWLCHYRELLKQLGFSEEEVLAAWRLW